MEPLDKNGLEFKTLLPYFKNTGMDTEKSYEIMEVYKIQRKGEAERIAKWKKLENHLLLWHGSRVANYTGILSQGLKIAPPEAPTSGLAFGAGVYFADMFSKSIVYTHISQTSPGFLLLCEVALGNIYEILEFKHMEKAPEGYHSVKALGSQTPDFSQTIYLQNGAMIPVGNTIEAPKLKDNKYYPVLNSEYIVYDSSQIRMRYLVQVKHKDTTLI